MAPPPKRVKKVMTLPINVIFQHLQVKSTNELSSKVVFVTVFNRVKSSHIFIIALSFM